MNSSSRPNQQRLLTETWVSIESQLLTTPQRAPTLRAQIQLSY